MIFTYFTNQNQWFQSSQILSQSKGYLACKIRQINFIWDSKNEGQMMLFDFENIYLHGLGLIPEV